jgi:hypothetical protein
MRNRISAVAGLLVAAMFAVATPANAVVVYTVTGTGVNQPSVGASFSFTYTSPTFINSDLSNVTLDSCSTSDPAYVCAQANFRPAADFGGLGVYDFIEFLYNNASDNSPSGSANLLFALGAFGSVGSYPVQPFSFSLDAVLTVSQVATPLPAALPLFATGLGAMGLLGWRRKRKTAGAV